MTNSKDSKLIDVWRVTVDGVSCFVDNEADAVDMAGPDGKIHKQKMSIIAFENLPEFEGF